MTILTISTATAYSYYALKKKGKFKLRHCFRVKKVLDVKCRHIVQEYLG